MNLYDLDTTLIVYPHPVNMHRSFNGLASLAYSELQLGSLEEVYILFVNRDRNQFKILFLSHDHIAVFHMRTSGTIQQNFSLISTIHTNDFIYLLKTVKSRRPRFRAILEG